MTAEQSSPPPTLVALVLPSLVPVPPYPATLREQKISEIARELQKTSGSSDLAGMAGLIHLGPEWVDRIAEILGRIGSAGEQLALALATNRDARRWTAADAAASDPQHATMGVRAQAEMTAMWTLSAAHGLANALVRLLRLNDDARKSIDAVFPKAGGFPPFSENPSAWVSFEPNVMKATRQAATASGSPAAIKVAKTLSDLFGDNRWAKFLELRNVGFHRWRPQSVDGGTPKTSSVTVSGGSHSIEIGIGPMNIAPDMETVLQVAEAGLDLFSSAAKTMDDNVHAAINELTGKPLFQV
ncbi:hypothetical protein ACIGCK_09530 [Microbacterium sp. NPDC078428]|uniref:hypothetical protein n=1 Tax=Microbacterium sp. NPDC078428 TaxID=3364190 RepID=UPI0037C55379